jgi:hypothetical protein
MTTDFRRDSHKSPAELEREIDATRAELARRIATAVAEGPEVETDWMNFGALNFPEGHPARDEFDTLLARGDTLAPTVPIADVERLGGGEWHATPMVHWNVKLEPDTFVCIVCNLQLHGAQELEEAGLQSRAFDVEQEELGPDFDINTYLEAMHADDDFY